MKKNTQQVWEENPQWEKQLSRLGLKVKDMVGDGNCLFRALGDQWSGEPENHALFRKETVEYMKQEREQFEAFIEDDLSFDQYVKQLAQNGYFGGHLSLVAFVKRYGVNIAIHQLHQPIWYIYIDEEHPEKNRTLHIAYHEWEHYSSVRNIDGGGAWNGPAAVNIRIDNSMTKDNSSYDFETMNGIEKRVYYATQCQHIEKIRKYLAQYNYDEYTVIDKIYAEMYGWEEVEKEPNNDDKEKPVELEKKEEPTTSQERKKPLPARLRKQQAKLQRKENRKNKIGHEKKNSLAEDSSPIMSLYIEGIRI